jgi:hypothetical protein
MDHPKCEVCGNPATIHETVIESGVGVGLHHLCKQHGESHWQIAAQAVEARSQGALGPLTEWYRSLDHAARSRLEMEYRLMRRSG